MIAQQAKASVFDKQHQVLSVGLLLIITLVAFENLAIVTVAPSIATELQGLLLYGWMFSAQLLGSLFSIVLGGEQSDKHGPALPFAIGILVFFFGLLLAGFAPNMPVFIMARFLQGLGGGASIVAVYVAVNLAYEDKIRSRMIAFMSTAWVVPALAGPTIAGFIAETIGWRYIFLAIAPFTLIILLVTLKSFLRLGKGTSVKASQWRSALILAGATATLLFGLGLDNVFLSFVVFAVGAVLAFYKLVELLPKGTLRLAKALPSVIASRSCFYAAFLGVEAFVTLMLSSVHGLSTTTAGLAIAIASVSWTAGAWLQDQWDMRAPEQRQTRMLLGSLIMTFGLTLQLVSLYSSSLPLLISLLGWLFAGLGIGMAHATSAVLAFALAPKGEEGQVSASLQLGDTFVAALATGIGGALFAFATKQGMPEQTGIMLPFVFSLALAVFAIVAAQRIGKA